MHCSSKHQWLTCPPPPLLASLAFFAGFYASAHSGLQGGCAGSHGTAEERAAPVLPSQMGKQT